MEIGALDASLVSYEEAAIASKKGMTVLAELSELVPEFPDRLIVVRRTYLEKERIASNVYCKPWEKPSSS